MTPTTWHLARGAGGLVFLHVQEREPLLGQRRRGYCVSVADRHVARQYLPILRDALFQNIAAAESMARPMFDAVDADAP